MPKPNENTDRDDPAAENASKKGEKSVENLKSYAHDASDDDLTVTFEVLLSPSMSKPDSKVWIAFGPPLSQWDAAMVEMNVKPGTPEIIEPGKYRYLVGVLPLNRKHQNKSIPYKYVVQGKDGELEWEFIKFAGFGDAILNRCLMVPEKSGKFFTKFDDVILSKDAEEKLRGNIHALQKLGRAEASKWMMPRPIDFDDLDIDFEAALDRFKKVIAAHGNNGTIVCVGDEPKVKFNPSLYKIEISIQNYIDAWFQRLSECLQQEAVDVGKVFRFAIYLTLLWEMKLAQINEKKNLLTIVNAFHQATEFLFQPQEILKSISGELQLRVVESLRKLVQDFVDLHLSGTQTIKLFCRRRQLSWYWI